MPRPKGSAKVPGSGRKRGSVNKRTLALQEALLDGECSIPGHIARLLEDERIAPELKMDFIVKLLPYLYPQHRPIEPDNYLTVEQVVDMQRALIECFKEAVSQNASLEQAEVIIRDFQFEVDRYRQNRP